MKLNRTTLLVKVKILLGGQVFLLRLGRAKLSNSGEVFFSKSSILLFGLSVFRLGWEEFTRGCQSRVEFQNSVFFFFYGPVPVFPETVDVRHTIPGLAQQDFEKGMSHS